MVNMDLYRKRLGFENMREDMIGHTAIVVDSDFEHSPHYKDILIENVTTGALVRNTRYSHIKSFTFRPHTEVVKGMYITIDGDIYLSTNPTESEIYPKVEATLCNNSLKWKDNNGNIVEYPCAIEGNLVELKDSIEKNQRYLANSEAKISIKVQYNEDTLEIKPKQRFLFDGHSYQVLTIDTISDVYKQKGLINLTVEAVSLSDSDNVDEGVAEDTGDSGWGGW